MNIDSLYDYVCYLGGDSPKTRNCLIETRNLYADAEVPEELKAALNNDVRVGYYPSLQYQYSQVSKGVLCDYSVDPPLSVDAEGRFLNKKALSKQSTADVYVTSWKPLALLLPRLGPLAFRRSRRGVCCYFWNPDCAWGFAACA